MYIPGASVPGMLNEEVDSVISNCPTVLPSTEIRYKMPVPDEVTVNVPDVGFGNTLRSFDAFTTVVASVSDPGSSLRAREVTVMLLVARTVLQLLVTV